MDIDDDSWRNMSLKLEQFLKIRKKNRIIQCSLAIYDCLKYIHQFFF